MESRLGDIRMKHDWSCRIPADPKSSIWTIGGPMSRPPAPCPVPTTCPVPFPFSAAADDLALKRI
jgi:hypothetical protein